MQNDNEFLYRSAIMGVVSKFLIRSIGNNNIKGVKLALSLHYLVNNLEKLFSRVNPFRNKASFNRNDDQVLNRALGYAVNNLDYGAMVLLINAGASVHAIGSDGVRSIIYKYKRALAYEKEAPEQAKEFLAKYKEKCCLVLSELIIHGAISKNNEEEKNILKIFEKRECFGESSSASNVIPPENSPRTFNCKPTNMEFMNVEVNNMIPPKKPPRTFDYKTEGTSYDTLLAREPIYAEVYDSKVSKALQESGHLSISEEPIYANVAEGTSYDRLLAREPIYAGVYDSKVNKALQESGHLSTSEESIYADVDALYKASTKSLSLEDSGYSGILEEPIYCTVDALLEQKKAASLTLKEPEQLSKPIYAKVDLFEKRAERKLKDIKANFRIYHGLVQDKVSQWQERIKINEQNSSRLINQQQTSDQKVEVRDGFSVKEIKQKYESKNSGYNSGYGSYTEVEQLRMGPKTPNSKVNLVDIECGIEKGVCVLK
ncbi:hypothetical protein [Wolbachia pipientis]|uniref:hypothetical protein n=1 Tax=Wolbachia pipientis TaxID=955 RepID=UPI0025A42610|nr:hypothetical protein [Wolbachia pipientis]MDM8335230.1 hypothetical protein [Wolbachia pipientis]